MTSTRRKAGAVTAALLPLLSAAAGILHAAEPPVFPQSTTGATIATRVAPMAHGRVVRFALTPDRTHAVLFERIAPPGANAVWQLRVLDDRGATLRERRLRPGYDPTQPDMYFTDRGELLIDDGSYFYVVDLHTLRTEQTPQCRKHAYPGRDAHAAEIETQLRSDRTAELARLAGAHGVREADVEAEDLRTLPVPIVEARRRWAQTLGEQKSRLIEARYMALIERFAAATPELVGIQVERPQLTSYYVRVNADGTYWYCDLEGRAQKYAVRWARRAGAKGVTPLSLTRGELTREGDVVHDGPASIQVLKASRTTPWTCSWQVGCVDRSDYRLRLAGLPGQAAPVEVATKDGGLSRGLAGGGAFRFANGHWLLEHDGLYLFTAASAIPSGKSTP